ncbi:MAG: hypothetical protein KC482_02625 [Dehalococcoidia bacterium]|nr:hypothetical protein [Dehalococcoidia bacterium]MCA9825785.1 hypothetical protein [Dehalococcoidia bacterium]MCA9852488.1 hypothetical protein [Dehalococcoidia bacterium]
MRTRILFAPLILAAVSLLVACGGNDGAGASGNDGDDDSGIAVDTPTPFPNDPAPSPALTGPASLYSISQDDLGQGYITDIEHTWVLTADSYGTTTPFRDTNGPTMLNQWGYVDGYETSYSPEGRSTAVLNGAYWIRVETHLMADEQGARELFDFFKGFVAGTVSEPVTVSGIGNDFAAWRYIDTEHPVGTSTIPSETHQYIFRRGNLVAAVQTVGAEPFMDVTTVSALARIIDQKALGESVLVEPTPVFTATSN